VWALAIQVKVFKKTLTYFRNIVQGVLETLSRLGLNFKDFIHADKKNIVSNKQSLLHY